MCTAGIGDYFPKRCYRTGKTSENYRKGSSVFSVFQVCFLSKKRVNLDRESAGRFITQGPLRAQPEWGLPSKIHVSGLARLEIWR